MVHRALWNFFPRMKLWPKNISERVQCATILLPLATLNVSAWTHRLSSWDYFIFGLNVGLYSAFNGTVWLRRLNEARGELIKHYEMREMLRGQLERHERGIREVPMNDWRNS